MNYEILRTKNFVRELKFLAKKYHSLFDDLESLKKELLENPDMGDKLDENTRKIRMAVTSKNKGKSGGARVITCTVLVNVENTDIYLLSIYDKSEQKTISAQKIQNLKEINGLL